MKVIKGFDIEKISVSENLESGSIIGYASTFGNKDRHGDVIKKGAFTKSLKENKGRYPVKYNHEHQIGWNNEAQEDDKGLFIESEILITEDALPKAKEAWALTKSAVNKGFKMGLSIGGSVKEWNLSGDNDSGRYYEILEFDIMEHSITPIPANKLAMITSIKSLNELENNENTIKELEKDMKELALLIKKDFKYQDMYSDLKVLYEESIKKNIALIDYIRSNIK